MQIREWADDMSLSAPSRLPVRARRLSQKVMLVLLEGQMWVLDDEDQRQTVTGPTWVVWFPGDRIEYGTLGETVHWLVAQRTGRSPDGAPLPGSRVRLRRGPESGQPVDDALVIEYLDESPAQAGPLAMVARADDCGVGVYNLAALVEVLDESDEDLHLWSWGPGHDVPLRYTRPPR